VGEAKGRFLPTGDEPEFCFDLLTLKWHVRMFLVQSSFLNVSNLFRFVNCLYTLCMDRVTENGRQKHHFVFKLYALKSSNFSVHKY